MRNNTETLTCPKCKQPVEEGQPICPECGTIINPRRRAPKMLTAWPRMDYILGFATALLATLAFCFPALGAALLYFAIRERYPVYGRGLWAGLLASLVLFLVGLGVLVSFVTRSYAPHPVH